MLIPAWNDKCHPPSPRKLVRSLTAKETASCQNTLLRRKMIYPSHNSGINASIYMPRCGSDPVLFVDLDSMFWFSHSFFALKLFCGLDLWFCFWVKRIGYSVQSKLLYLSYLTFYRLTVLTLLVYLFWGRNMVVYYQRLYCSNSHYYVTDVL